MNERSRKLLRVVQDEKPSSLGELIHEGVKAAIEQAIREELAAVLGTEPYERAEARRGYRNGTKPRQLSGPTGPLSLEVPRATLFTPAGRQEWVSRHLPRYQRRLPEINEALTAAYLAGANTRRIKGALRPLLKAAPLSKSAISRVVVTLKAAFDAWRKRSLEKLEVVVAYLDAFAIRVRSGGKVVSVPVLAAVVVLADGSKQLVSLELCGSESHVAWKGFLDDLVARGLRAPLLAVIDGNAGLRSAVGLVWPKADVQRCTVHKLRNIERKVALYLREEIADDYRSIVYATNEQTARTAWVAFERKWEKRCPGAVASLTEGGDELLTYFRYPAQMWKTLRTTNVIERLNGEFRRRVKTQGSYPTEDAGPVLLFSLIASGQIKLRKLDGYEQIAALINTRIQRTAAVNDVL